MRANSTKGAETNVPNTHIYVEKGDLEHVGNRVCVFVLLIQRESICNKSHGVCPCAGRGDSQPRCSEGQPSGGTVCRHWGIFNTVSDPETVTLGVHF